MCVMPPDRGHVYNWDHISKHVTQCFVKVHVASQGPHWVITVFKKLNSVDDSRLFRVHQLKPSTNN